MPVNFGTNYLLAQGAGTNFEPVRRNNWECYITGIDSVLTALSVTIPATVLTAAELHHFNEVTKYATMPNPGDISVEILDTLAPTILTQLQTWFQQSYNPNFGTMGLATVYKRQCRFIQYDPTGLITVRTWTAKGCWLKSSPVPSEALDYSSGEAVKLKLTISCDRVLIDTNPF